MRKVPDFSVFRKSRLALPPLLMAILCLPMALGLIPPNGVYGYRTTASMSSPEAWYASNQAAGLAGVALGFVGVLIIHLIVKRGPASTTQTLLAAAVSVLVVAAAAAAGSLA